MTHVSERVVTLSRTPRLRGPLAGTLAIALLGGSFAVAAPFAAAADPVTTENGWSYTKETFDTGVRNGYQLALDAANRKVYLSDAAWSAQTRTATKETEEAEVVYGDTVFTVGNGKLAVFDTATRNREDDHSFLNLTRNDGTAKENEEFSWEGVSLNWGDNPTFPKTVNQSITSMRTTFSPYGVAVDGTTPGGATIITTTARQRNAAAGYGGGVVVYSADQGAPTDDDRVFEFEDGTPVLQGPRRIAVNTVTHKAYVTSLGTQRNNGPDAGYLTEIDLVTREVTARIAVPGGVGAVGVAVDETNNLIYPGAMAASKLYVIDGDQIDRSNPKSFAVNEAAVTELDADMAANQRPTYNAELKRLYVSAYDSKNLYVVDADPESADYGKLIHTIATGPTNAVEVDGERGLIYSANLGDKNVVVFDAETHEKLLTLPTSGNALNIGIDPVSRDVWVSNFSNVGKVDVFTVESPFTETTAPAGGTLITPKSVPLGSDITISGKGFFLKNGDGGSAGPIFVNQGPGCAGTGPVNVKDRTIENQQPDSTFSDARAHGVFYSDAEGDWTITIPFPTEANSTITEPWKVGDVQCIRILTGSLVPESADHSRSVFAQFTIVEGQDDPEPVEDQAAATVPAEWVEGQPLTVTGAGWTWPDGVTGSTVAIKLNGGSLVPLGDPHGEVADNVYAIIDAADGSFSVDLPFPGAGAVQPNNTPAKAGDQITINFLTGSLAPGDRVRSVPKTVTVVAAETPPVELDLATPAISGDPNVGSTLTAEAGDLPDGTTLRYQWFANGSRISGATSATLKLTKSHKGKAISVGVTAVLGESSDSAVSESTAKVAATLIPVSGQPVITGAPQVGKKLTANGSAVTTTTAKTKRSYQWYADGVAIKKATKSTFTVAAAQLGKQLTVKVVLKRSGYATAHSTASAATAAVAPATFANTKAAKITGTLKVGKTIKATGAKWSASKVKVQYKWYATSGGVTSLIQHSTSSKLKLTAADRGAIISVELVASKAGYTGVTTPPVTATTTVR